MLTFYPEFETQSVSEANIIILLDMSNSMKGQPEEQAKKVNSLLNLLNLLLFLHIFTVEKIVHSTFYQLKIIIFLPMLYFKKS
jgi:hypothetical protein